jgi:hypothetical protein
VVQSLRSLQKRRDDGEDVAVAELTLGEWDSDPADRIVTNDTPDEFIQTYVDFGLNKSIENEFDAFAAFDRLFCGDLALKLLDIGDVDEFLSAKRVVKWDLLRRFSAYLDRYGYGYGTHSPPIMSL